MRARCLLNVCSIFVLLKLQINTIHGLYITYSNAHIIIVYMKTLLSIGVQTQSQIDKKKC